MSEEPDANNKREPLSLEVFISTRQAYDAAELEVSGRYDKWILTLAGGALGLSITFIEKIAKNPTPDTLCWLKCAWFFLIVALLLALSSLVTSQSSIRENRSELDSANDQRRAPALNFPRRFTKLTNWLNWTSLVSFVFGVILLCIFSSKNIDTSVTGQQKEKMMANDKPPTPPPKPITEGFVPPPPPPSRQGNFGYVPSAPPKVPPPPPKSEK